MPAAPYVWALPTDAADADSIPTAVEPPFNGKWRHLRAYVESRRFIFQLVVPSSCDVPRSDQFVKLILNIVSMGARPNHAERNCQSINCLRRRPHLHAAGQPAEKYGQPA